MASITLKPVHLPPFAYEYLVCSPLGWNIAKEIYPSTPPITGFWTVLGILVAKSSCWGVLVTTGLSSRGMKQMGFPVFPHIPQELGIASYNLGAIFIVLCNVEIALCNLELVQQHGKLPHRKRQ